MLVYMCVGVCVSEGDSGIIVYNFLAGKLDGSNDASLTRRPLH